MQTDHQNKFLITIKDMIIKRFQNIKKTMNIYNKKLFQEIISIQNDNEDEKKKKEDNER